MWCTWPCPAPSGLCVLTILCRSGTPVGQTLGSRCSSYIPSQKAWLLIWMRPLPEYNVLFALNSESNLQWFVLLLNVGSRHCVCYLLEAGSFLFAKRHKPLKTDKLDSLTQIVMDVYLNTHAAATTLLSALLCNLSVSLLFKLTIHCCLMSVLKHK